MVYGEHALPVRGELLCHSIAKYTHPSTQMINPNIRASIISGLLYPLDYFNPEARRKNPPELWELPDTSILFRRYLDSGKMINVYDWFESFAVVLESQKRHAKRTRKTLDGDDDSGGKGLNTTPQKGKGKQRQVDEDAGEDEDELEEQEDEDEKWKMQVQARFMRSLHELDYLGFIKHTGRKADHVMRTVFDVAD
jgi:origin recognition complex subunit 3